MFKFVVRVGLLLAVAGVTAGGSAWAEDSPLENTRDLVSKWVEMQQLISKEKKDWSLGKDVLEQRISLVDGEISSLEGRIQESKEGLWETRKQKRDLEVKTGQLKAATSSLEASIATIERKTKALFKRLPAPVRDQVERLERQIPADPAATELSLAVRYQNVLGILNQVNKFNNDILVVSELRELESGSSAEVSVIYVGLGQAFFANSTGTIAGTGRPGDDGWVWTEDNDLASDVLLTLQILNDEAQPAFVPLPVTIQ